MNRRTRQLLRENKKLIDQLTWSDQVEVEHVVDYLKTTTLSNYEREMVRRDLLLMVIEGHVHGENAKQVLGDDPLALCEAIVSALPKPTAKEWVLRIARSLAGLACIWMTFILVIIHNWLGGWHWGQLPEGMIQLRYVDVLFIFVMGVAGEFYRLYVNQRTWERRPVTAGICLALYIIVMFVLLFSMNFSSILQLGGYWLMPRTAGIAIAVASGVAWLILNVLAD